MDACIAVLVSGSGTNLQALLDDPQIRPHVALVVSDRPAITALERASRADVDTTIIEPGGFADRHAFSRAIADELDRRGIDVLVSAGYMRILGPDVVKRWHQRFLNVHPALLPAFPGMHAVRDALAYGVKTTGVTVFLVDAGTDTGPVIAQEAVPVSEDDDVASLHERIKRTERALLVDTVGRMVRDGWSVRGRTVQVGHHEAAAANQARQG